MIGHTLQTKQKGNEYKIDLLKEPIVRRYCCLRKPPDTPTKIKNIQDPSMDDEESLEQKKVRELRNRRKTKRFHNLGMNLPRSFN